MIEGVLLVLVLMAAARFEREITSALANVSFQIDREKGAYLCSIIECIPSGSLVFETAF